MTTKQLRYTDTQVRDMLENSSMWIAELRIAAQQRGCKGLTSVTPINLVMQALEAAIRNS